MAAYCGLRCSTERRSHCRELQRWNRSMLLAVGLDTVFEHFAKEPREQPEADSRRPDYARDWKQSNICEVCKCKRTATGPETTEEPTERPAVRKPTSFNISDITKSKSFSSAPSQKNEFDFNPFTKGFPPPSATATFNPHAWTPTMFGMIPNPMIQSLHSYFGLEYHPPPFPMPFPPSWASQSTLNGMLANALSESKKKALENAKASQRRTESKPKEAKVESNGVTEEQPLDLSSKSTIKIVVEDVDSESPSDSPPMTMKIDVKQENGGLLPPKMPLMVGTKRNYSQLDLEKAVMDIRSGRLGTRRASVVYGIPRSTLRNKIYKLEAAAEMNGEPSQYKRRRAGGQTLQERLTAGESIRQAQRAMGIMETFPIVTTTTRPKSPKCEPKPQLPEMSPPPTEDEKRENGRDSKSQNGDAGSSDSATSQKSTHDPKKTRPKRGHYRQYGKSKLEEAVQTVRRGEMSVHKAGSLFGVPHSTLEYKVKERNLMRHRKNRSADESGEDCKSSCQNAESALLSAATSAECPVPLVTVSAP